MPQPRARLGVIVGNRGFFPGHLCETGRQEILRALREEGVEPIIAPAEATRYGAVENYEEARRTAQFLRAHRDEIDGVVVSLPNFGDERAVADTLRMAGLDLPVLVHAFPDEVGKMGIQLRRDAFCGKMSVCNNLRQYGVRYSLTTRHTVGVDDPSFREDLRWFASVARVVKSLKGARFGAIGARPAAFNTVRYSEKLLERAGISVVTVDLSDVLGRVGRLDAGDPEVTHKLEAIRAYVPAKGVPPASLERMAKLGVVVDRLVREHALVGTAIQCWTALEEFFGIVPCTLMSMMSNALLPSACETDVTGAIAMYVLQQASGRPSAIVDWNNNYGDDPDKGVIFHCSNLPKEIFEEPSMHYQEIIAGTVGKEQAYGTVYGRVKPGPFTYLRISTDDEAGLIRAYVGEGELTRDPVSTFGGYGVVRIPHFQELLRYICDNGFEHHVSINMDRTARAVEEALARYLGWQVYRHEG
ncbi:L-fucose/L-arabinose isomerase family protein [Carboxydochorda subterranea]|uniref:L-fucose/L-arabinose isomerase family protein n=1 Tax=Carboxydichorda subterranea TaxID=3109565 RepID=A0ABZ1BZ11_9FIRM|nr:L-fucose/L-arabinose isomerase family protein [Limnochorda sp. L945t]WRP17323.1 L-fucose/L-arabinose isomerase family protein [Limnochorda sp. L945t]